MTTPEVRRDKAGCFIRFDSTEAARAAAHAIDVYPEVLAALQRAHTVFEGHALPQACYNEDRVVIRAALVKATM